MFVAIPGGRRGTASGNFRPGAGARETPAFAHGPDLSRKELFSGHANRRF